MSWFVEYWDNNLRCYEEFDTKEERDGFLIATMSNKNYHHFRSGKVSGK